MLPFRVGEFLVEPQLNTIVGANKSTRIELPSTGGLGLSSGGRQGLASA